MDDTIIKIIAVIAVIIVIMFLAGNKALIDGDTEGWELAVGIAVIGDIALVIFIFNLIINASKNKIKENKCNKILEEIKELEKEKEYLKQKNEYLVSKIENQKRIIGVINLVKYCGANVSSIENNPAVNGIVELSNEIKENKISIEQLSAKINYLNITLKEEKEI